MVQLNENVIVILPQENHSRWIPTSSCPIQSFPNPGRANNPPPTHTHTSYTRGEDAVIHFESLCSSRSLQHNGWSSITETSRSEHLTRQKHNLSFSFSLVIFRGRWGDMTMLAVRFWEWSSKRVTLPRSLHFLIFGLCRKKLGRRKRGKAFTLTSSSSAF